MAALENTPGQLVAEDLAVTRDISVRRVPFDAPWDWLAAGWRDMWAVPSISLTYGAVFALIAAGLLWGATHAGAQSLILALSGGFLLVGPLAAAGLYEASRRLQAGQPVTFADTIGAAFHPRGQMWFLGVALMLIFMVWMQLAFLLLMLFQGSGAVPPPSEFLHTLLFTKHGLGLLTVGTLVGAALAALTFSVAAVSVPLLMVKDIDIVTAIATSIKTVVVNPKPMLLWAALIAGFNALGFATLLAGLVIAFPLVGHATWHAFRQLVDVRDGSA